MPKRPSETVTILLNPGYLRAVPVIDGYENKKKRELAFQKFLFIILEHGVRRITRAVLTKVIE